MKIRHGDLEACRRDPVAWVATLGESHAKVGYARLTALAIYNYHKNHDLGVAVQCLGRLASSYHLTDQSRLDHAEQNLSAYIEWVTKERPTVVKWKVNVRLPLAGDLIMAGEVSRIDNDGVSGGYRAVLLTETGSDWRRELKMPLLQLAAAAHFPRDPGLFSIGTQRLDGSGMETIVFSESELLSAQQEAVRLAEVVLEQLQKASAH